MIKHIVNGVGFRNTVDAIEYRDHLDANYIRVVWVTL